MSKIFNIIFFIFINIKHFFSLLSQNNTNIVAIKFKTYYPYIENETTPLKPEDYFRKIHSSKIYLELQTENQVLNTIINLKEVLFHTTNTYFEKNTVKNNNLLCSYNTSKSKTFINSEGYYKFNGIKDKCSYAKEKMKLHTDLSLDKYNITQMNFLCSIKHNISTLCGNNGLIYFHTESHSYNIMGQIHKLFSLNDFTFLFNYSNSNSDEGLFIIGNKPHVYSPDNYDENDLYSFYTKYIHEFNLDAIDLYINDNCNYTQNIYIKINPDFEGFQFPEEKFFLFDNYFEEYFSNNICEKGKYYIYTNIFCHENFTEEMIKSFPTIEFRFSNISLKFFGEDLFYKYKNKFYFKIIGRALEKHFDLGRLLLRKYIITFNPESRQIFFYKNKENKEDEEEKEKILLEMKYIIIIIVLSILLMILVPIGFYLGKKFYQNRKRKAYELSDGYDYTPSNEEKDNVKKESLFKDE